ncbi:MAG: hypothetical protein KF901_10365 [Myxococcales bacterium]|nr:hypothetical protein [Myxococcales bacterium]
MRALRLSLLLLAASSFSSAHAQSAEQTNAEASDRVATGDAVQNRQTAAQAYDRAASLYVAGEFAQAGQWFMTAYRLAPSRAALVQAVRSYQRSGDLLRAGTLALLLGESYPNDAAATELATQLIEEAGRRAIFMTVECDGCTVEVDGRLLGTQGAFLRSGQSHRLIAHFGDVAVEREVRGADGEQVVVAIERPAEATVDQTPTDETPTSEDPAPARRRGLSPHYFVTGVITTAALGGLTVWSGLNTLSGVDAYEANPTQEAYDRGVRRERRTNAFIGLTAAAAVTTAVLAILTNFKGDDAPRTRAAIAPTANGAIFVLEGSL